MLHFTLCNCQQQRLLALSSLYTATTLPQLGIGIAISSSCRRNVHRPDGQGLWQTCSGSSQSWVDWIHLKSISVRYGAPEDCSNGGPHPGKACPGAHALYAMSQWVCQMCIYLQASTTRTCAWLMSWRSCCLGQLRMTALGRPRPQSAVYAPGAVLLAAVLALAAWSAGSSREG